MQRIRMFLRTCGLVGCCGLAALVLPLPAHAGDVHVSIGPSVPVAVVVPPAPVVVAPPPAVIYPAPVVVERPPVVVAAPQVVYAQPSLRGYYRPWRHHHHGWHRWE